MAIAEMCAWSLKSKDVADMVVNIFQREFLTHATFIPMMVLCKFYFHSVEPCCALII